jgi:hypothetical protein
MTKQCLSGHLVIYNNCLYRRDSQWSMGDNQLINRPIRRAGFRGGKPG